MALRSLPETFYEAKLAELDRDYEEKKAALDRQKVSAEFDAEIIKATFLGTTSILCRQVTTNELKGESVYFWIRQVGRDTVHLALCEILSSYGSFFRESKFMTDGEIISIANFFIDSHPHSLRFSELMYFMNNAVLGTYGKIYGDLTATRFFELWVAYCEQLAIKRENEHADRKNITRPVVEKIEDLFKSKFSKWDAKKPERPKVIPDENYFGTKV